MSTIGHRKTYQSLWLDMARRKLRFHPDQDWKTLTLWGLAGWGSVRPLLGTGELKTHMTKANKTVWVWPSEEAYHAHIEPLLALGLEEIEKRMGIRK